MTSVPACHNKIPYSVVGWIMAIAFYRPIHHITFPISLRPLRLCGDIVLFEFECQGAGKPRPYDL